MVVVSLLNLHLLASHLNLWTYVTNDSLSVCWISMKWLIEVWISVFDIFRWRESLISSQFFCAVNASQIKVLTNPFDFPCANLVLLSPVNSEAVSMSISQSTSCEESCPFKVGISCSKELSRDVFFCAVHRVSVYLSNTFSIGASERCSVSVSLWSLCSNSCIASLGSLFLSSTTYFKHSVLQSNFWTICSSWKLSSLTLSTSCVSGFSIDVSPTPPKHVAIAWVLWKLIYVWMEFSSLLKSLLIGEWVCNHQQVSI